jgi:uncharacterized membrane protein
MTGSSSMDSYLRETRALAVVAVLALTAGIVSDALGRHFWTRHALLANLAASLIVVMLSVALVNEAVERRRRRRWRVLAQPVAAPAGNATAFESRSPAMARSRVS